MKVMHIICKDDPDTNMPVGVTQIEPKVNKYMSCCWDFDLDEMKELIGGMIFFHNSKTSLSKFGGKVLNVHPIKTDKNYKGPYYTHEPDKLVRADRMMFEFEITADSRNIKWRGKDHMMAYSSGIIDLDDE